MKERIRELRKRVGITQEEFGKRLGVKRVAVTNWEIGKVNPSDIVIKSIVREFGVDEDWLLYGATEMYTDQNKQVMAQVDAMMISDNQTMKAILRGMSQLRQDEWKTVERILEMITKERGS